LSFFRNTNSKLNEAPGASGAPDVQTKPLALGKNGSTGQIKVDLAYRLGSLTVVAGWSTAGVELGLRAAGRVLQVRRQAVPRPDVATHFNLPSGADLGFVLVAESAGDDAVTLCWREHGQAETVSQPLVLETQPKWRDGMQAPLGSALALLCAAFRPHTDEWKDLVAQLPSSTTPCENARAFLEGASACAQTEEGVAWGWLVHTPGTQVWLEDDAGHTYPLDKAFRRYRQDVYDAVGHEFGHADREAGFVLRLPGLKPGSRLRLKALSEAGVHLLSETSCGTLPADPVAAARLLFNVYCPLSEMHRRVGLVDEPVLAPLIQYRQDMWDELPVQVKRLGAAVERPLVSLIIPLYGRTDFVEHQLIEFAQDAWLQSHAEIIYVVDDPKLVEPFAAQAEALFRLYRLPFTWVWGSVNRGFSGANNLGARQARGEHLLFLNSDAFPQAPGWLESLLAVLQSRPDVGAVAPRLVFGDGAIQHAGMRFMRRDELGVWVNHHPCMGLDPALDPAQELTIVPAVTGACLALRRTDFDRVGGWDTGYLVGDFEDSDLCLKLREAGLNVAYLPSVQLTHLERQSFKLLGQDDLRTRVVIYNAVRHQNRWRHLIEAEATAA
jgi:Predicted glycosyltransferases